MQNTISRRDFIIKATAATAAVCTSQPLLGSGIHAIQSTLSPAAFAGHFDVARNRLAYQSSAADDNHTAHLVTDGSTQTWWESAPGGEQWISIDLGDLFPIDRITIHWCHAHAQAYQLQISSSDSDHAQWTTAYETTQGTGGVEQVPLDAVSARKIRLLAATAPGKNIAISEFQVWSTESRPSPHNPIQTVTSSGALLTDGWALQSAMFTASTPMDTSSTRYSSTDWIPAIVPGTILASYLAADTIPDPFYGDQQSQVSEDFFTHNDFWYRDIFEISPDCRGRRLWLVFEGINWKADVYLNGTKLGSIKGAFIRTRFDITSVAVCGGENCVAVLIHKVAHPGEVQHKQLGRHYRNGGILGLDSPTFLASIGWNWLPTIRGRNTGIWNNVRFETSADVILEDPWITTESLSPDNSRADLAVKTEIKNLSSSSRRCTLSLSMENILFKKEITLQPNETRSIAITKSELSTLAIQNPRLWWPNGYGEPTLHTMRLRVEHDGRVRDEKNIQFGIRKIDYRTDGGILAIYVNGCKILCRGGNWGMDNGMLMCTPEGYDLRVRMHRDMNLVMIRNWVGMVGHDAFYDACDRYGILIWDDFWLANPSDGPDPSDHAMFMSNAADRIRRTRHHPSLALYCGRNEGDPPPDIDAGLRAATSKLDGTRFYISGSASGLVTGHGPYDSQDPAWYFEHRGTTFHSEQGLVCVPPVESMRTMMPEASLWPISDMWAIHDYQDPRSVLYTERIGQRYGTPSGIDDYCRKAQMLNLESAKAIYESLQSHQGSGQLIWMTQAAWPALICQLYDYYFEQTAAYFGAKTACEPLHILWDSYSNVIKVANNTPQTQANLHADAWIYDLDGRTRWHKQADLGLPSTSAQPCFSLDLPGDLSQVFFVKLKLSRGKTLLSENFYWAPAQNGDCSALNSMPSVNLNTSARLTSQQITPGITTTISNPTHAISLAVRLKAVNGETGERILPAMYEDNYFSLLPGESRRIRITFPHQSLSGKTPHLIVEGWNIAHAQIRVEQARKQEE
jgi:Glycosyl hydrolase 2 galactose-binding domain-like/Exo-beta-D-glucosaminidase Ig-fold domain/NedA-like, galactose-binding domain/Glycosyl hydrolases family 2